MLDELERQTAALRSENEALRTQAAGSESIAAALTAEMASLQGEHGEASRERDRLGAENQQLRAALDALQAKVLEVQRRDAETSRRIRDAMERTQAADLLQESLAAREAAMTREFESLRGQLLEQRTQFQSRVDSDVLQRTQDAERRAREAEDRATDAEQRAYGLKLLVDRLEREHQSMRDELGTLRKTAGLVPGVVDSAVSAVSLREQLRASQREVEELKDRTQALSAREHALSREVDVLRETHEGAMTAVTRRLHEAEDAARTAQARQGTLQTVSMENGKARMRFMASKPHSRAHTFRSSSSTLSRSPRSLLHAQELAHVRRQLAELVDRQRTQEEGWRSRVEALRTDKDLEIRRLIARLEQVEDTNRRLLGEAEALVASKEAISDQWRREAHQAADKVREVLQQAREAERDRLQAINRLEEQLTGVSLERAALCRDVESLKAQRLELERTVVVMKNRMQDAEVKAQGAVAAAELWMEEKRELMARVDRAELSKVRGPGLGIAFTECASIKHTYIYLV